MFFCLYLLFKYIAFFNIDSKKLQNMLLKHSNNEKEILVCSPVIELQCIFELCSLDMMLMIPILELQVPQFLKCLFFVLATAMPTQVSGIKTPFYTGTLSGCQSPRP